MLDRQEESIALLDEGAGGNVWDESEKGPRPASSATTKSASTLLWWTAALLSVFILADLVAYLYIFRSVLGLAESAVGELEFRNPYVGLAELYSEGGVNASRYAPIVNIPRVAAQVSSAEPDKVFPEAEHRYLSNFGTMSPNDRHLQVSSSVHTILQFRAMDFGMERCALTLRLPSAEDKQPFTLIDPSGHAQLDICALDVARPLNTRSLSWATRPQCTEHLGTLSASPGGEIQFAEFPCSWGSLHTYEVSCAPDAPDCQLDVWASRNGTWGIFMYQFQTV